MGTSRSKPSAPAGSPIIPPWATQDPTPPAGGPPPPPPPPHEQLEERRTTGFRRALGEFYRTGDSGRARSALGQFARGSMGGGASAGNRFGRAATTGGAAFGALSSAIADQSGAADALDIRTLAGRPVNEAINEIVDAFAPPGILDEDAIRAAMAEALAEAFSGLDTFDPTQLDGFAVHVAVRCYVAELVFIAVMAEQGAAAADVSQIQAVRRENDIRQIVRDTTDLRATPILARISGAVTPRQVEGLVRVIATEVTREIASW